MMNKMKKQKIPMLEQFQYPLKQTVKRGTIDTPCTKYMTPHFPGLVHAKMEVNKLVVCPLPSLMK
jgi:hypothetical protein